VWRWNIVPVYEEAVLVVHHSIDEIEAIVPHRSIVGAVKIVVHLRTEDWNGIALSEYDVWFAWDESSRPCESSVRIESS